MAQHLVPTRVHLLRGNPGHKPSADLDLGKEVPLTPSIPPAPEHLGDRAVVEWNRVCAELAAIDLLTQIDMATLASYCQAWDRWVNAEIMRDIEGDVIIGARGSSVMNPWVNVSDRAFQQMYRCMHDLGFSPAARVRLRGAVGQVRPDAMRRGVSADLGEFAEFVGEQ